MFLSYITAPGCTRGNYSCCLFSWHSSLLKLHSSPLSLKFFSEFFLKHLMVSLSELFIFLSDTFELLFTSSLFHLPNCLRGGSKAAVTSKMEHFVIIVNDWKPFIIIAKRSILDVSAALDLPLCLSIELRLGFSVGSPSSSFFSSPAKVASALCFLMCIAKYHPVLYIIDLQRHLFLFVSFCLCNHSKACSVYLVCLYPRQIVGCRNVLCYQTRSKLCLKN